MELAAHAVLEERRVVAEVVGEVGRDGADRVEPRPLFEAPEGVVADEEGELDVGEGVRLPGREGAEHQRARDALVPAAGLPERGLKGLFGRKAATTGVKKSVREIAEELGYSPSRAVKDALIGKVPLESIPPAERKIAAEFYERVANEAVTGQSEIPARALNKARAKFLREGGEPPVNIHPFKEQ